MSTVSFFHDGPLYRGENGQIYDGVLNDKIIDRYFFFGERFVSVTRIYKIVNPKAGSEITRKNASFISVPNLNTLKGKFFYTKECHDIVRKQVSKSDYIIARLPSYVGSYAVRCARELNKPYLIEIVGCPLDSLRNHSWKGKLLAPNACLNLKKIVKKSPFALYVTEEFLQRRYPCNGVSIGCSDVVLNNVDDNILEYRLNKINKEKGILTIGTCGILNVKYKGQEHVIKALAEIKKRKYPVRFEYQLVGPGDPSRLVGIAKSYKVDDMVKVIGPLTHEEVFNWLDNVDIYIQPSDTEGLCRALLEAMSRACPCIASNAGGNPELIDPEYVFRKKDYKQLASLIVKFVNSKDDMVLQAKKNFGTADHYNEHTLNTRRYEFYKICAGYDPINYKKIDEKTDN